MLLTPTQAMTVDIRTAAWGQPPYNGATAYRPDFDHWLAGKAEADGAELVCSTTVVGLLREPDGRVVGVRTDRPDGDVRADVVIACDGVNSFCAKEAGLHGPVDAGHYTLGVKETLALPKAVIDERFAVRGREGVDIEIVGGTGGVNGGAFLYTNLDTVAVGVVLELRKLAAQQRRPEEIIAALKEHPAIAPLVDGGEVKEYSAHVIPEAGLAMMPKMTGDGMLVAGDAAALCLAAGIWLEGVNFAMASGIYAGEAAVEALAAGDTSSARARRLRATARRDVRAPRPPQAAPGTRSWCSPTGCSTSTRSSWRTPSRRCSGSTTRAPSRGCAGSWPPSASGPACAAATSPATPWPAGGRSGDDRAGALAGAGVRGPHRHDRVRRPRAPAHRRRRHRLPGLQHPRLRRRLPGEAVRPDRRRRDPLQLRAVLRVRHLLPRLQPGGRDLVVVPGGRVRSGVPALVIVACWKWAPAGSDDRKGGISPADEAALEVALRLAEASRDEVTVVSVAPPDAERGLREALAAGAARAVRVDAPCGLTSAAVAAAIAGVAAGARWVVCGDVSADRGTGAVPAFLAAELDAAQALGLVGVEVGEGGGVRAVRRLDGGRREVLAVTPPAVLSVEGAVARLRRASLTAELDSRHAVIEVVPGRTARSRRRTRCARTDPAPANARRPPATRSGGSAS